MRECVFYKPRRFRVQISGRTSDFYPGYDGFECRQQKCLAHLIRDLNDDLWSSPFDAEFEKFVLSARDLLVPMIEAVHGRSAKRL